MAKKRSFEQLSEIVNEAFTSGGEISGDVMVELRRIVEGRPPENGLAKALIESLQGAGYVRAGEGMKLPEGAAKPTAPAVQEEASEKPSEKKPSRAEQKAAMERMKERTKTANKTEADKELAAASG
jgi:hypothetical protein